MRVPPDRPFSHMIKVIKFNCTPADDNYRQEVIDGAPSWTKHVNALVGPSSTWIVYSDENLGGKQAIEAIKTKMPPEEFEKQMKYTNSVTDHTHMLDNEEHHYRGSKGIVAVSPKPKRKFEAKEVVDSLLDEDPTISD